MSARSWKWSLVAIAIILGVYGLLPTVFDGADGELDRQVDAEFLKGNGVVQWVMQNGRPLTLGLDLQGGLLLQYQVLVDRAVQDQLDQNARDIEKRLEQAGDDVEVEVTHGEGDQYVTIRFENPENRNLVDTDFMGWYPTFEKRPVGQNEMRLAMKQSEIEKTKKDAVKQALDTIKQRVNALGVSEPSIRTKGKTDIVVQLPGLEKDDVERAKELIGQTAKLRFRMVDDEGTNKFFEQFKGNLPPGFKLRKGGEYLTLTHDSKKKLEQFLEPKTDDKHVIGYKKYRVRGADGKVDEEKSYWKTYYIFRETKLTGERVQDARVRTGRKFNKPYVSLNFDVEGTEKFGQLSKNNVGERMAIMLDDKVQSAPVFNEAIMGGRARITMGGRQSFAKMQKEARDLVIVLRHGALAAPIEMQYETVVGPTLGQSSIEASTYALQLGSIAVILLMLIYYQLSGVISVIALLFNLLLVLSGLGALGATLTLPGIAGIILTVGMAVDANVIIFERIREEIRAGKQPYEAMQTGFDKGFSAVFDANITTLIAALILMQYGTGPIRGFAVTLLIGILSTLFTAVFVARLIFEAWISWQKPSELSI